MEKRIFLLPGEIQQSREPACFSTLLGSCVSVCLYDRRTSSGGMNHYMLSTAPFKAEPSLRYGDYSIDMLVRMMRAGGSRDEDMEAYVLGGARVSESLVVGENIGAKNIALAKQELDRRNIPITKKNVGGDFGRKVYFWNRNGEVEIKKVEKSSLSADVEHRRNDLSRRKIRVLVVDDSPLVCDILEKAISSNGDIEVIGLASDAYEAREMLIERDPDVVTLDIIMPRMDGVTFLRKILKYRPKPVIVISTMAKKGSKIREQVDALGAVSVLDKEELNLYEGLDKASLVLTSRIKMAAAALVKRSVN